MNRMLSSRYSIFNINIFLVKLFQYFSINVRLVAMTIIHQLHEEEEDDGVHINKPVLDVVTVDNLLYFKSFVSWKLQYHPVMGINAVAENAKRRVCR